MKYFLHDSNAFNDEKISELFIKFGYEGIGLFFTILEKISSQEKPIKTSVLKHQLKVGKKLEKCWSFMEEIELISSNNGETFNKQLLNFSEKYKIKKQKNAERISKWRENQLVTENVTRSENVRNAPKVKLSKEKEIYKEFFDLFIEISGKKIKTLDSTTLKNLPMRYKEGYTNEDFRKAIENCKEDKFHKENPKYLTTEFITRSDKLSMYLSVIPKQIKIQEDLFVQP